MRALLRWLRFAPPGVGRTAEIERRPDRAYVVRAYEAGELRAVAIGPTLDCAAASAVPSSRT